MPEQRRQKAAGKCSPAWWKQTYTGTQSKKFPLNTSIPSYPTSIRHYRHQDTIQALQSQLSRLTAQPYNTPLTGF